MISYITAIGEDTLLSFWIFFLSSSYLLLSVITVNIVLFRHIYYIQRISTNINLYAYYTVLYVLYPIDTGYKTIIPYIHDNT